MTIDLDNAVGGLMGVATIGLVAGTTERIINRSMPRRNRARKKIRRRRR